METLSIVFSGLLIIIVLLIVVNLVPMFKRVLDDIDDDINSLGGR